MGPGLMNYPGGGSPFGRREWAMVFEQSFETEPSDDKRETIRSFRTDEEGFDDLLRRREGGR